MLFKNIKKEIEHWQKFSYSACDRDPANIPNEVDEIVKDYTALFKGEKNWKPILDSICKKEYKYTDFNESQKIKHRFEFEKSIRELMLENDPELAAKLIEDLAKWRTTKYQDPIKLGPIAFHWECAIQIARKLWPGRMQHIENNVLLATVPLGILNGLATVDQNGEYGIIVHEGLRFWPSIFASDVISFLSYETDEEIIFIGDLSDIKSKVLSMQMESTKFISKFYHNAVKPGIMQPVVDPIWNSNQNETLSIAMTYFRSGFIYFVLAHELAHCINHHCEQILKVSDKGYQLRSDSSLETVFNKISNINIDLPQLTYDRFNNFIHRQFLEHIADYDAFKMLIQFVAEEPMSSQNIPLSAFFFIGGLSFFWYIELMERVLRTIQEGEDWVNKEVYNLDFEVQNFLFRRSHPAPLSRVPFVLSHFISRPTKNGNNANPIIKSQAKVLSNFWELLCVVFETLWKDNFPILVAYCKYNNQDKTVDKKWSEGLPLDANFIGLDEPLSGIYNY